MKKTPFSFSFFLILTILTILVTLLLGKSLIFR